MKLQSFGGLITEASGVAKPVWPGELPALAKGSFLPVGMSKSYGDVALSSGSLAISSLGLNRFLNWDAETGILECEAGVLLSDIQSIFVKQGWLLPVTPGTSLITVGGAIANDVHGKDHHLSGTFGEHVLSLELVRSSGEVLECSPTSNEGLFRATIGGLGLTGFITKAKLKLRAVAGPYFDTEVIPYQTLGQFFALSEQTELQNWEAAVS